ncbi:molybdate ABC transporter permease subunit, partial [Candidatus Frankia alpina]
MTSPGGTSLPWTTSARRPHIRLPGRDGHTGRSGRSGRRETRRRTPWALWVPGAIAALFLLLPLIGLLVRAPWSGLPDLITEHDVREALFLSLETATAATALSLLFGIPLAWLLARTRFPGRSLLRALVTLPLVLPPVVGGV